MNPPTLPTLPNLAPVARATPLPRPRRGQGGAQSGQGPLPTERGKVDRPHALYRFWDDNNNLLYVGITVHLPNRVAQHRGEKEWWTEIATITIEHHPDRESVLEAEHAAIRTEHPVWNVIHNTTPGDTTVPVTADEMPDNCERCATDLEEYATYYPTEWRDGRGYYICRHHHRWTCSWGHGQSGTDKTQAGKPAHALQDTLQPVTGWLP